MQGRPSLVPPKQTLPSKGFPALHVYVGDQLVTPVVVGLNRMSRPLDEMSLPGNGGQSMLVDPNTALAPPNGGVIRHGLSLFGPLLQMRSSRHGPWPAAQSASALQRSRSP